MAWFYPVSFWNALNGLRERPDSKKNLPQMYSDDEAMLEIRDGGLEHARPFWRER
jgi:hypothetical protein